jgi:hypothetical protein
MFRAPLCPSSGAREYYRSSCCLSYFVLSFQVVGTVWSWGLCVRFAVSSPHTFVRGLSCLMLNLVVLKLTASLQSVKHSQRSGDIMRHPPTVRLRNPAPCSLSVFAFGMILSEHRLLCPTMIVLTVQTDYDFCEVVTVLFSTFCTSFRPTSVLRGQTVLAKNQVEIQPM